MQLCRHRSYLKCPSCFVHGVAILVKNKSERNGGKKKVTWLYLTEACVAVVPAAHVCAAAKVLRQNTPQPDQAGLQQLRLFSYPCKAEVVVTCPDVLVEEKQERQTTPPTPVRFLSDLFSLGLADGHLH